MIRTVTQQEKVCLREKLVKYQHALVKQVNVSEMVTCPHHLLEFNSYHINQVIDNCHKLFTIGDIMSYVEIWRHEYAIAILRQISDVFKDVNAELLNCGLDESFDSMSSVPVDGNQIRDDSSLVEMMDSQDISSFIDTDIDTSVSLNDTILNV